MQASKDWRWTRSEKSNRLHVDLGPDLELMTPFKLRLLTEDTRGNPNFSLQDAEFYNQVFQYLQQFAVWNDAICCQIALNATAAKHYLLPMQPKSWFFKTYEGTAPINDAVVVLESECQRGEFLIVECYSEASLCINLQTSFQLDEHLVLEPFQAIKVLNNRIHPLMQPNKSAKTA
ncbi:hypothetical protein PALB_27390 [Pseudoalteromonas luteoviolacea B = ATCC 29581]|nr:hypothetical protein PALB_27390 [Pseudoalteromonas luteoviolacea B = ATCC 29581]